MTRTRRSDVEQGPAPDFSKTRDVSRFHIASRGRAGGYTRRSFINGVLAGAIGGASAGVALGVVLERGSQGNSSKKAAPTWSDEFSGPSGAPPDPAFWSAVVNGGGGGNLELEYYVPSANRLDGNGNLVINAERNSGTYQAWYGLRGSRAARSGRKAGWLSGTVI